MINESTTPVVLTLQGTSNVVVARSGIIPYLWTDMLDTWANTLSTWDLLELQNTPVPIQITNLTI